jgi:hypothetical protein
MVANPLPEKRGLRMSDNEEKKRPNAKYKLSKENIRPEELTYFYDRDKRLANAPRAVKDLYKEQPPQRRGFLRLFVRNKPRSMTFISIIMCCVLMIIAANVAGNARNLGGNRLSFEAIKYEGLIIVTLKKKAVKNLLVRNNQPYTGTVDITALPVRKPADGQKQQADELFNHRLSFTNERQEQFRFVLPFDSDELVLVLQSDKQTLSMTVKPE